MEAATAAYMHYHAIGWCRTHGYYKKRDVLPPGCHLCAHAEERD